MFFVDRDQVEERLQYIEELMAIFTEMKGWSSSIDKLALERIIHMTIEAILDVGNSIIDGFIMRDPGSYEDIMDILEDEKVITMEMCEGYKRILSLRKILLQHYIGIHHDEIHQVFSQQLPMLKCFASNVRGYLENELGPVTSFKR